MASDNGDCGQVSGTASVVETVSKKIATEDSLTCLTTVSNTKDATLLDIRPHHAARNIGIAEALKIPLADLATRTFLKDRSLVLVGSGKNDLEIATACVELKKAGFAQVKVLSGGLRAWHGSGQLLVTEPLGLRELYLIESRDFHNLLTYAVPVIALFNSFDDSLKLKSGVMPLSLGKNIKTAGEKLKEIHAKSSRALITPHLPLVVVPQNNREAEDLQSLIIQSGIKNTVILKDGALGYTRFLAEQESIQANANTPLIRPCNVIGSNS